ncbi:hypothetical protein PAXINDRAFT_172933 [Paxillus involutus ATCC 200175]|uniref:WW domain-containing protein n=1 Tax=Paxillus involutus ATCC 200175 TaxID=664439 RepID=A0A0C9TKQ5_PAXIN|nr:hypothetical protein PAXINDRAFT_172933 [Paxillus involutus ATCC 200175]
MRRLHHQRSHHSGKFKPQHQLLGQQRTLFSQPRSHIATPHTPHPTLSASRATQRKAQLVFMGHNNQSCIFKCPLSPRTPLLLVHSPLHRSLPRLGVPILVKAVVGKCKDDWKMQYDGVVTPGERDYAEVCPPGWTRLIQAEGASYYYHSQDRVFTDADMSTDKTRKAVESSVKNLFTMAKTDGIQLSQDTELVIELGERAVYYYFVDRQHRILFWLHAFEHKKLLRHVKGVTNKSHIKYHLETQYWTHCEMFPHGRPISLDDLKSLKGTLIHANAEAITSDTSLAPFDIEELGRMLDLVDKMQEGAMEGQPDMVWVIARLTRMFSHAKFVNFYGQLGARLNADQSVYADQHENRAPRLFDVVDIFLFGSASAHFRALNGVWVDHTVNFPRWKGFINKLLAEWNSFTIYSTVMLAVDVSFLAIPALQDTSKDTSQEQAAVIAIYGSIVSIVGSLMISVLLVGQIRGQEGESAKGAADFMKRMTQSMLGLEALAIMQSVPYALLIWGMLFFVLALGFVIFGSPHGGTTIAVVSPGWVLITFLCLWPLWGSRRYRAMVYAWWGKIAEKLPLIRPKQIPSVV